MNKYNGPWEVIASSTLLCNLPDAVVDRCDGELYEAVRAAGYAIGVRQLIDQWNCWSGTVGTFLALCQETEDDNLNP